MFYGLLTSFKFSIGIRVISMFRDDNRMKLYMCLEMIMRMIFGDTEQSYFLSILIFKHVIIFMSSGDNKISFSGSRSYT